MKPQLLVSVRSADEALTAIAGGCDILDVKEPANGSLGMADVRAIRDVCQTANEHAARRELRPSECVPVSAALGETRDWFACDDVPALPLELAYVKLGTAGSAVAKGWARKWRDVRDRFEAAAGRRLNWIAVVYADWQRAAAPPPEAVIDAALASQCAGVLFDTFFKDGRTMFDGLPPESLCGLLPALRTANALIALAGSLSVREIPTAVELQPDVIAVRTAACEGGRRNGPITTSAVRRLRELLANCGVEPSAVSVTR